MSDTTQNKIPQIDQTFRFKGAKKWWTRIDNDAKTPDGMFAALFLKEGVVGYVSEDNEFEIKA